MTRPEAQELAKQLIAFLHDNALTPRAEEFDSEWRRSGVYAVLDCVFSSQTRFETVERVLQRFGDSTGLTDEPWLTFSAFLDVMRGGESGRPSPERFKAVAVEVFKNEQKIARRLKVEVAYDVCLFFAERGLETKQNLRSLPRGVSFTCDHPGTPGELERLVMNHIVNGQPGSGKVHGMGIALGAYLLICLGDTTFVKPDTLLLRSVGRIGGWQPRASNVSDFVLMRQAISCAADELGIVPAHLDHLLWKEEREREERSDRFTWTSLDQVTIQRPSDSSN